MSYSIRVLSFAVLLPIVGACSSSTVESDYTKEQGRELLGVTPEGEDICALEGWYSDAQCDDFCVQADPDCSVSNCPDPANSSVVYRGEPGSLECAQEIGCAEGFTSFNSADCGCGCITPEPPSDSCGGIAGVVCAEDEFCDFAPSDLCGGADALGECKAIPDVCPELYAPVCGCDGVSYQNACAANGAGVSVATEGECGSTLCGPDMACADGFFCDDSACGAADAAGTCQPRPEVCPEFYSPVCGCDGVTYSNECHANGAGTSAAFEGECDPGSAP
jgi:hypothetical protein